MDVLFSGVNTAEAQSYLGFYIISIVLGLVSTVLVSISRWHIFKKLGLPGWKGIIPIYGDYKLFKSRWRTMPFWVMVFSTIMYYAGTFLTSFLMSKSLSGDITFTTVEEIKSFFIPYIAAYGLLAVAYLIVTLVITLNLNYQLAKSFGDGIGFALGLTILPIVFYPLLAFEKKQNTRKKRPLQMVSGALTLALVFSVVTSAPFAAGAAETDNAAVAAAVETSFGELSSGKYTLTSTTYQLTADFTAQGYLYVPSGVEAVIDLNGHTIDRGLTEASATGCVIKNEGTLTITDSGNNTGKITGGYAEHGGAVNNSGTLTINGGTFVNNKASLEGGAVMNASGATLTVNGGVFRNNSAETYGGGAFVNFGTMTFSDGTIFGNTAAMNGAGVWSGNGAVLNLSGGVISGNKPGDTQNGGGLYIKENSTLNVSGAPVVKDNIKNNLFLDQNAVITVNGTLYDDAKIDIAGTNLSGRALTSGLDGQSASVFTFANGATAAKVESGEIVPDMNASITVNTWAELQTAINNNNAVIALGQDITSNGNYIKVDGQTVTIDLCGHTINRNRSSSDTDGHAFWVTGTSDLTVRDTYGGGKITGGYAKIGGALEVSKNATLSLYNVTVSDNKVDENGAAIFVYGTLNISGTIIKDNTASDDGGAIYIHSNASKVSISGALIAGNKGNNSDNNYGGAIYQGANITTTIENSFIENNGSDAGGAIYLGAGTINMTNCTLNNNDSGDGGAVFVNSSAVAFNATGTTFTGNKTTSNGGGAGGAIAANGVVSLTDCTISGNTAYTRGGGLWSSKSLTLENTVIENNTAAQSGGAVYNGGTLNLTNCVLRGNTCGTWGGGVYLPDGGSAVLNLNGGRIENNTCGTNGGGVHVSGTATMNISGAPVIKNNYKNADNSTTANNLRLSDGTYITKTGDLSSKTEIAINAGYYNNVLVKSITEAEMVLFTLDDAGAEDYTLEKSYRDGGLYVEKTEKATVNSWAALQSAVSSAGAYKKIISLSDNITASSSQTRIQIGSGKKIIIDLNGKTMNRGRTSKDRDGHVIEVFGDLTVRDTASGGKLTGGWANNGGGVNIGDGGKLTLESGTITGNKGDDGGGVHVKGGGSFTMTGGTIDNNNAADDGGGVYVADDSAVFTMSGGTISNNTASDEGGGILTDYKTTITGGKIEKNKAKYGGGVYYDDNRITLSFSGLTVSENTATEQGGAIYLQAGKLNLDNCTIQKNTSGDGTVYVTKDTTLTATNTTFKNNKVTAHAGGAIVNNSGSVTLTSCTVDSNAAKNNGGGVWTNKTLTVNDSTFTNNKANNGSGGAIMIYAGTLNLYGGTITGNMATSGGSGVYVSSDASLNMKGKVIIKDNSGNNLLLTQGKKINLVDKLLDGSAINVAIHDDSATVTTGYKSKHGDEDPANYFSTMAGSSVTTDNSGEVMIIDSEWTLLRKQFAQAGDNSIITLDRDWTAISKDKTIVVPEGKSITLDLNGYTIDGDGKISSVIDVNGTLTVKDASADKTGKITGSGGGSGIYVSSTGKLNFESGEISGNSANNEGGGINNTGTLVMSGGKIGSNNAKTGGGIHNSGTATITGGSVTGNTASENGGGIFNQGTLNFEGGSISGNNAVRQGGGIFVSADDSAVLNVSKVPIVEENKAPIGNNILLTSGRVITIKSALYQGSKLDVVTKNTGLPLTKNWVSYQNYGSFTYNGMTGLTEEKNGELYYNNPATGTEVSSWTALQNAINSASNGGTIVLTADVTCDNGKRLLVKDKAVTIDLNGHRIDRNNLNNKTGDGQVFGVMGSAKLTISDASGTGVITGGRSHDGGGMFIEKNATVTVTGGSIQGNLADKDGGDGGGFYVEGTLIMTGGSIAFNTADDTGGGIYCTDTGTIQLSNALITGNYSDDDDGGAMNIHLKDNNSYIKNCTITNNRCGDNNGGGIRMDAKGKTLTIEKTHIEGNKADERGGGIHITRGKIEITDSFVNHNSSEDDGGGVYGESGATLIAVNTQFNYNTTVDDGGAVRFHGPISLTNCKVMHNSTDNNGGGLYFDNKNETMTLIDTDVEYNDSGYTNDTKGEGGGIKVYNGSLTIKGGSISHNKVKNGDGSAIYFDGKKLNTFRTDFEDNFLHGGSGDGDGTIILESGEAHIQGGTFSNNFVKNRGGGVYVAKNTELYVEAATYTDDNGKEVKEPVTFNSNLADQYGGSIYLKDNGSLYLSSIVIIDDMCPHSAIYSDEDFDISGKIVVDSAKGSGLYMESDEDKVHIEGKLETGSHIHKVELEYKTGSFTDGFKQNHGGEAAETYFTALDGYSIGLDGDGEVRVRGTDWLLLQQKINNAASGSTITLEKDYKADWADSALVIPANKDLTIDLHGYKLDGDNAIKGGTVIKVSENATLRIEDSYVLPDGVTGTDAEKYEGTITGGTASAIVNNGTLYLFGGRIYKNKGGKGGGINNYGVMTVEGARIKSNSATEEGAGIYNSGTLYLYGGEITANTSAISGGGIFCAENSKIYAKGAPYVKGNYGASGKNIVLSKGTFIEIDSSVDSDAKLDVTVKDYKGAITKNYAATGSVQGVFTYNENANVTLVEKEGELYVPFDFSDVDVWVGSWSALQSAVNNSANQGKVIGLSADLTPSGQERIEVENGRQITIELAGHTMNRGFTSKKSQGNVFKVADSNTHLTIRDTLDTGVICGGYAKGDGGGFYVVDNAKLTIESGTVYGNGASSDGGGIYVDDAELVMTGGAVSNNYAADNGAGIYTSKSAKITLTNAQIIFNTSKNAGGGFNTHLKQDATFTNCMISYNKSKDKDGGGIVMNASDRTLYLVNCKVDNNTTDDEGGGIYVDAGTVDVSGGQINSNTADDGGGVYISGGDKLILHNDVKVGNNRTLGESGGGITCHGKLEINTATISLNSSAKYGGGIYYKNSGETITLKDANISCNTAANDGGGIYIQQGTVDVVGGKIAGNKSIDGGGVFVTNKTEFNASNGALISENISSQEDGGGIVNKGTTTLTGITVEKNIAKYNGGGIWNSGDLTVTDCTIKDNKAKTHCGGGIHHSDGDVTIKGSTTIKDNQAIYGGGIYVEEEADYLYIQDKPVITDNSGNVYLYKEYITLTGQLQSGAKIGIGTYTDTGVFTRNFKAKNIDSQPSDFFFSDYGYEVVPSEDEAALKWVLDEDTNSFIDRNNNIADSNKVSGRNWMSAVSGERNLNEINIIRAHDAAMNNTNANIASSKVTLGTTISGYLGAPIFFAAGIALGIATGGAGWFIAGAVLGVVSVGVVGIAKAYENITAKQAKTQYRYVDELMDMGVRVFDLRLNNKNWEERNDLDHDDNVNLWHCHGESDKGGCIYGCDHDGSVLSVNDVLNYAKEFLKKNPTEVLYFEYSLETQDNEKFDALIASRLKKILREFSYEINPSTGKPYLYMEDGEFGKEYTYWPKLKDARGQLLYTYDNWTNESVRVGGYTNWEMGGVSPNYTRIIGGNGVVRIPVERIQQTEDAVKNHPLPNVLTDAMVHRNINSGLYVNTTDDPMSAFNWFKGKQAWMTETPLELEEKVLYGHGDYVDVRDTIVFYELHKAFGTEDWYDPEYEPGYEGLLKEGGFINQTGSYYGIFSFDGITEKEAKMCWSSNFYDDLEYCTVTVKSGLDGDDSEKTYKVLKGTAITIPNCIYEKPESSDKYFQNWHAETGHNSNWEPSYSLQDEAYFGVDYNGRNNREWLVGQSYEESIDPDTQIPQDSERDVMPGDTVTIMDDTEFTAVWDYEVKMSVNVVWQDGDDADELRPGTLKLNYQTSDLTEQSAKAEANNQWSTMISGCTDINTLAVDWDQINVSDNNTHGDPDNGYSYTVTGDIDNGITVTMYHTPQKTVDVSGLITWDDNDNLKEVRPDSVTLRLLKNGEEIDSVTATAAANWSYSFSDSPFPEYSKVLDDNGNLIGYQRDVYSVTEDPFSCYSASYDDFNITNVFVDPDIEDVIVEIDWKDNYNVYGERPESVTLHLWDGDTEIDSKEVLVDSDEAATLTYFDVEKYELKHLGEEFNYHVTQQDEIPNYSTEYNDIQDNTLVVVNTYDNSGKYFQGHSLSLNGDIGVNFYLNLTPEELSTTNVKFQWFNKTYELSGSDLVYNEEQKLYKASCPVAVAEMTYDVNATLYIDGEEKEMDKYSVVKYANVILSDKDFYEGYIAGLEKQGKTNLEAKEKYSQLIELVLTMLDYGAKAQLAFDRDTDNLANGGVDLFTDAVTSGMIESKASDMDSDLEQYGLEYQYSTVLFLSKTSLRHYYKITDETQFNAIKDSITFNGNNVVPEQRGDLIFFELQSIAASKLDTQYILKIGDNEYHYSVMDYTKRLIDSDNDEKFIELAKATYRFSQAANAYFKG